MTSIDRSAIARLPAQLHAASIVALIEARVPADVVSLLVEGDPARGIEPGALTKAIEADRASGATLPESDWHWWAGENGESFTIGPCATKAEVIAAAEHDQLGWHKADGVSKLTFHIMEARQDPISLADHVDFDNMIENAELSVTENLSEADDGIEIFSISTELQEDLESRLSQTMIEWQVANNRMFGTATFTHQRNAEKVLIELPAAEAEDNANEG